MTTLINSHRLSAVGAGLIFGGVVTDVGLYRYHTFTISGNLIVTSGGPHDVEVLVVGGGGGAGRNAGGAGGGGGFKEFTGASALSINASQSIVIGAGGAGSTSNGAKGVNGGVSSFGAIAVVGGGGGGSVTTGFQDGAAGASGGGGGYHATTGGVGGIGSLGGNGGTGFTGGVASARAGGGGGGAGGNGANYVGSGVGGAGGAGLLSTIATALNGGSNTYYAGGGGGGGGTTGGAGQHGGGNGESNASGLTAGTANTGGGGGSASSMNGLNGAAGGSGIVIVRYILAPTPPDNVENFFYTGSPETWVVPTGVTSIDARLYGAQGGTTLYTVPVADTGAAGGKVETTLAVTPGETLNIYVGEKGKTHGDGQAFNGGGSAGPGTNANGGGGGGASDIRQGGTALTDRIAVAGGGGGGGGNDSAINTTGVGGGTTGGTGNTSAFGSIAGGTGGTPSAGGTGYASGALGVGADPEAVIRNGGGGGGGYYGGGSGLTGASGQSGGGGGGGSSYSSGTGTTHTAGNHTGDGLVSLEWITPAPDHDALVLAKSPSGFWLLNESSGTNAASLIDSPTKDGTAATGVLLGAGTTAGGDFCPTFDGSNSADITVPDHTDFSSHSGASGTWSLTTWIYGTQWTGANRGIVSKGGSPLGTYEWQLVLTNAGVLVAAFYTSSGSVIAGALTGPTLSLSTWYHIGLTYDRAAQQFIMYVDGVNVASDSSISSNSSNQSAVLRIGGRGDQAVTDKFIGSISRVALYPTVLSSTEINDMFSAGV